VVKGKAVPAFSIPYEMPPPYQTPGRLQEMLECDGRELAAGLLVMTSLAIHTPPHLVRKWGVAKGYTHAIAQRLQPEAILTTTLVLCRRFSLVSMRWNRVFGLKHTLYRGPWQLELNELDMVAQGMGVAAMYVLLLRGDVPGLPLAGGRDRGLAGELLTALSSTVDAGPRPGPIGVAARPRDREPHAPPEIVLAAHF
jgi:hypothetical protein